MGIQRALYVVQHHEYSGAETSQAPVIRADPDALVACPAGSQSERFAHSLGARTVDLPFRPLRHSRGWLETLRSIPRGLGSAYRLRALLRQHPDRKVVYGISIRPAMLASLAALGLRRTVIWCVPDLLPPPPLGALVRLLAWIRADGIVCLSEYIADEFVGSSGRLARLSRVIHPGVDAARLDPGTVEPGAPCAAIVGHISPVKRTDLAVDICALVTLVNSRFTLRVIGSAQFRDEDFELERTIRARIETDSSVAKSVHLLGRQADVSASLIGCGMLLHCRADEPFGMVMVEAMGLGLPVVAPASGGALEIVEDGVSGFLYPPGNVARAADCVVRLISDRSLAASMSQAARRRVEDNFTVKRQVDLTSQVASASTEPA